MSTERHVCQTCLENVDAELQFYKLDLTYDLDDSTLRDKLYSCVPEYEDVLKGDENESICAFCFESLHLSYNFRRLCLATKCKLEAPDSITLVKQEIIDDSSVTNYNPSIKTESYDDTVQIKTEQFSDSEEPCKYALVEIEGKQELEIKHDDRECGTNNLTLIEKACKSIPLLKEKNITPENFNCNIELCLLQEEQLNQLLLGNSINCEVSDYLNSSQHDYEKPRPKMLPNCKKIIRKKKCIFTCGKQRGKKQNVYDCKICDKKFATKRYLNEHLNIHATNRNEQLSIMTAPADVFEKTVNPMLNDPTLQQNKNKQDSARQRKLCLKPQHKAGTKINQYYIELITSKFQSLSVKRKKTQQTLQMPPKLLPEPKSRRTKMNNTSMPVLVPVITSVKPKAKLELLQKSTLNVQSSECTLTKQELQSIHESFGISVKPVFSLLCDSTQQYSDVYFTAPSVLKLDMRSYMISLLRQTSSQQTIQHPPKAERQSVNTECAFDDDTCNVDESIGSAVADVISFLDQSDRAIQKGRFKLDSARHRKPSLDSVGSEDDVFISLQKGTSKRRKQNIKEKPQAKRRRRKQKPENANKRNPNISSASSHNSALNENSQELANLEKGLRELDKDIGQLLKCHEFIVPLYHQKAVNDNTALITLDNSSEASDALKTGNYSHRTEIIKTSAGSLPSENQIKSALHVVASSDNPTLKKSVIGSTLDSYENKNEMAQDIAKYSKFVLDEDSPDTSHSMKTSRVDLTDNTIVSHENKDFIAENQVPYENQTSSSHNVITVDGNEVVQQNGTNPVLILLPTQKGIQQHQLVINQPSGETEASMVFVIPKDNVDGQSKGTKAIVRKLLIRSASNKSVNQPNDNLLNESEASAKLIVPEKDIDGQVVLQSRTVCPKTEAELATKGSSHQNSDLMSKQQISKNNIKSKYNLFTKVLRIQNQAPSRIAIKQENASETIALATLSSDTEIHKPKVMSKCGVHSIQRNTVIECSTQNQFAASQPVQTNYVQDNTLYETAKHPIYLQNHEGNLTVLEQTICPLLEKRSEEGFCVDNATMIVQTEANCSSKLIEVSVPQNIRDTSNPSNDETLQFIIPASSQNNEDYITNLGQITGRLLEICDEKVTYTDTDQTENTRFGFHIQTERDCLSVPMKTETVELLKTEREINEQDETIIYGEKMAGTETSNNKTMKVVNSQKKGVDKFDQQAQNCQTDLLPQYNLHDNMSFIVPARTNNTKDGQDDLAALPSEARRFTPKRLCKSTVNNLKVNSEKDIVPNRKRKRTEAPKEIISPRNTVLDNNDKHNDSAESFELRLQLSEDETDRVAKKPRVKVGIPIGAKIKKKIRRKGKALQFTRRKVTTHKKVIVPLEDKPVIKKVHNVPKLRHSLPRIAKKVRKMQDHPLIHYEKCMLEFKSGKVGNNHVINKKSECSNCNLLEMYFKNTIFKTNEFPATTECECCGKHFHSDYFYNVHKHLPTCSEDITQTSTKDVQVESCGCNVCDTPFEDPVSLKLPSLVHNYDKPSTSNNSETINDLQHKLDDVMGKINALKEYKCKHCNMSFVSNAQLKMHCAFKHGS